MASAVGSLIRSAIRKPGEPLNILTGLTHERFETGLCKTGHNFYAFGHDSFKPRWATEYAKIPDNYRVFNKEDGDQQIPPYIDFDLILSQNKFGQFQIFSQIARQLQLPLISLEHTLPVPMWPNHTLMGCQQMRGHINVFISEYSIGRWGWELKDDTCVVRHCVDTELFKPMNVERKNQILTVANDYIGRDWCLNFQQYQRVTEGLPVFPVGDTKGLSLPAESTEQLIQFYNESRIFLNTAHISPIPTSLLEAMACGCACVSVKASEIPYYIEHGVNGFLAENDTEMKQYLEILLGDEELCHRLGNNARMTMLDKCSEDRFISEWKQVFDMASKVIFRG